MADTNENITFKGDKIEVAGDSIAVGSAAPEFTLTANDMSNVSLGDFKGKVLVLSVVPSIDTPVCQVQTKRFNEEATSLSEQVEILTVSVDLPFAQSRWCGAEGVERVKTASDYRERTFGEAYGTYLPGLGILTRAVFVVDGEGTVQHVEYVNEVAEEPNYEAALGKVEELLAS